MIQILGISGSPIKGGNTETFLSKALEYAESLGGISAKMFSLAERTIADCNHCNWCLTRQEEGKPCKQEDDLLEIFPSLLEADALLLATPVYLARLSGYMAAFLDRLRCCVHGNLYKNRLEDKVGGALSVAWLRHGGLETTLLSLIYAFMSLGMIPVGSRFSCAFGAPGLASHSGTGQFDPKQKHGILEDEFGIKTMESLVRRVTHVARKIQGGEA